jgi:hypothetical protein
MLKVKHQKAMLNQFVLFGSVIFQFNGLNITNWQGGLEKRYKKTLEILFFSLFYLLNNSIYILFLNKLNMSLVNLLFESTCLKGPVEKNVIVEP